MNEQSDAREYLDEAEKLVSEWYSRDGVEGTHRANLEMAALHFVVNVVRGSERPLGELRDAAMVYLVAAFQMGRACGNDGCSSE